MHDVVVIGAGQAGLAASHELARLGVDHLVLERDRVGASWRSQRWDSFALNTPNWMNGLPGDPDPDGEPGSDERDGFASGETFATRLATYANRHGLPVRTGVAVDAVTRTTPDGPFFVSTSPAGDVLEARAVIVASGIQNVPLVPPLATTLPAGLRQIHVADYRAPSGLPSGAVLVVGSAQSGVQVVEDLLAADRKVYLCTSAVGRFRRRTHGRDTMEWLVRAGFFDQVPEQLPDPRMMALKQPQTSGVGPRGHTVSLQALEARGAVLLGRPTSVEVDTLHLDDTVGANIAFADRISVEFSAAIENGIRASGAQVPPLEPDPADELHPDPGSVRSPTELDLERAGIASVVWATGFSGDFGYLRLPVLDERGGPLHEAGMAAVPGLAFLGLPWLRKRKSGIILGAREDAETVVGRVVAGLARD